MNESTWLRHKLRNSLQSVLLLAGMMGLTGAVGWLLEGPDGVLWALVAVVLLIVLNPMVSPKLILGMYRARELPPDEAPALHRVVETLAYRAGLPAAPRLYYVPSAMINAFAVGTRGNAAVACTDGLLGNLSLREITGVLAHEISHIRNNDMWVMGLADLFTRMTNILSLVGQFLLLLNLPLLLMSGYTISWAAILLLVFAPTLSALLQLALSRTREYDADLGAAELSGDPEGLALALAKLERLHAGFFEQVFLPGRQIPEPSLLRTHPPTEERIRRLLALRHEPGFAAQPRLRTPGNPRIPGHGPVQSAPRWHIGGLWY